jgi:ankyrin repeat protein
VPVYKRDLELVQLLLAAKPDVNGQWRYPAPQVGVYRGDILLHLVAARSAEDVPLLSRPARFPSEKAIEKLGPEMRAKRLAILDSLVAAGADVNRVRPNSGHTPLTLAVNDADLEIVERLLKAGANPLAEAKIRGKKVTALSLAQQANATELITLLVNAAKQVGLGERS